ncbi:MAG TPA: hypothetical protein VG890_11725 [Puia sp.]|nr:hypothetical protein [Puia sp.]
MKTIGFLKDREKDKLGDSIRYEYPGEAISILVAELDKVIEYLGSGKVIFSMTLSLQDNEGNVIAPYEVLTDGEWLWPRYFVYGIKVGHIKVITAEFYRRMKGFNFLMPSVSSGEEISARKYFEGLLLSNHPKYRSQKNGS